jgi:predicted branched-subunit amino acid permease
VTVLDARAAFRQGAIDMAPVVVGVIPFGLVAGAAAVDNGMVLAEALGFSVLIFAGASQLAAIDLLGRDAPALVAIGTVVVINLRMLMYGASLAPYLAGAPAGRRLASAYLLTDQAYAMSLARFISDPETPRLPYYLGSAVPLWANWQLMTAVGAVAGSSLPETVPLGFAVPLVFLALLAPAMQDRPTIAAGVASGAVATVAAPLPANLGMPMAAATGVVVGLLGSVRAQRRERTGVAR